MKAETSMIPFGLFGEYPEQNRKAHGKNRLRSPLAQIY
jgi:hypothetical protein